MKFCLLISREFFVGREHTCNLALDNRSISRKHLKIQAKMNKIFVTDLDSRNGSFLIKVNQDEPTERQKLPLEKKKEIEFICQTPPCFLKLGDYSHLIEIEPIFITDKNNNKYLESQIKQANDFNNRINNDLEKTKILINTGMELDDSMNHNRDKPISIEKVSSSKNKNQKRKSLEKNALDNKYMSRSRRKDKSHNRKNNELNGNNHFNWNHRDYDVNRNHNFNRNNDNTNNNNYNEDDYHYQHNDKETRYKNKGSRSIDSYSRRKPKFHSKEKKSMEKHRRGSYTQRKRSIGHRRRSSEYRSRRKAKYHKQNHSDEKYNTPKIIAVCCCPPIFPQNLNCKCLRHQPIPSFDYLFFNNYGNGLVSTPYNNANSYYNEQRKFYGQPRFNFNNPNLKYNNNFGSYNHNHDEFYQNQRESKYYFPKQNRSSKKKYYSKNSYNNKINYHKNYSKKINIVTKKEKMQSVAEEISNKEKDLANEEKNKTKVNMDLVKYKINNINKANLNSELCADQNVLLLNRSEYSNLKTNEVNTDENTQANHLDKTSEVSKEYLTNNNNDTSKLNFSCKVDLITQKFQELNTEK